MTTIDERRVETVATVIKQFLTGYCRASTSYEEQAILADMTRAALLAADAASPAQEDYDPAAIAATAERILPHSIKQAHAIAERVDAASPASGGEWNRDRRQAVVVDWGARCFGADHMADKIVRAARFFEEAAELVQAVGLSREHALRAFYHAYDRPVGDVRQEAGGVGVTLMALCNALGLSADTCEVQEIERCLSKTPESFAIRNVAKIEQVDMPAASPASGGEVEALKSRIDSRLNDYLCEMKPDYDDSIVGFNEAWDIVRKTFADAMASASPAPAVTEEWQPIETAPKDGPFFILLYCAEDNSRWLAKWQGPRWHGIDELGLTREGHSAGDPNVVTGWAVNAWRPLPAPPTMIRGDGA